MHRFSHAGSKVICQSCRGNYYRQKELGLSKRDKIRAMFVYGADRRARREGAQSSDDGSEASSSGRNDGKDDEKEDEGSDGKDERSREGSDLPRLPFVMFTSALLSSSHTDGVLSVSCSVSHPAIAALAIDPFQARRNPLTWSLKEKSDLVTLLAFERNKTKVYNRFASFVSVPDLSAMTAP